MPAAARCTFVDRLAAHLTDLPCCAGSRATFAGAASRQRRLSKPSVHEILIAAGQAGPRPARHLSAGRHPAGHSLPAAPPLAGSGPVQLARGDVAGGQFLAKEDAPSGALLHWGARPAALAAPTMPLAGPAGWYMPVPVPVGAGSQGGYLLHPGMMMAPAGTYVPGEAADVAGPSAKAAPTDGSGKVAANGPDGPAVEAADALPDGDLAQLQTEGEPAEHRRCPGTPEKAVAVEEQYDVAASWPPYEGAKLPPLHQVREHWGAWQAERYGRRQIACGIPSCCVHACRVHAHPALPAREPKQGNTRAKRMLPSSQALAPCPPRRLLICRTLWAAPASSLLCTLPRASRWLPPSAATAGLRRAALLRQSGTPALRATQVLSGRASLACRHRPCSGGQAVRQATAQARSRRSSRPRPCTSLSSSSRRLPRRRCSMLSRPRPTATHRSTVPSRATPVPACTRKVHCFSATRRRLCRWPSTLVAAPSR